MGTMLIPDQTGHSTLTWAPGDLAAEDAARDRFAELRAERLLAFEHEGEQQYAPLAAFDADVAEILWVRPLQGG